MANNSPTIVAASLSDDQLKKSIDSLVTHVDEAMKKMVQSTNNAVGEMEAKLKSLGNLKIDSGGSADGGSSRRTSSVEKETKARKELSMTLDQQASAINTAVQSEKKYTDEVLRQAAAIRSSKEWQEKGHVVVGDINYYDKERANVSKRDKQLLLSLEEQIVQAQQKEAQEALVAAEAKRQQAQATKEVAQATKQAQTASYKDLGIRKEDLNKSVGWLNQNRGLKIPSQDAIYLKQQISGLLEVEEKEIKTANTVSSSYAQLAQYLKQLQSAYNKLGADRIKKGEGIDIANEIQRTQRAMQKLQQTMSRPVSLKDAMGLSEKTLDDIAYKMRQLASYRSGLNIDTQKKEIQQVNDEYNRLKKRMDEVMQKNQQMIASNTALGRSWNYMKNRLAFYFTVGASTQFVKNLIEIRSQYEMNERALGILINSAERGTQIFNELSQMALVSPYTLIELSAAAKQLTAYDIAVKDVVNTTRRLADMAAAVGIPIERLTYALGQVKAYGYLNARDARMFANAGIPLVKNLSEYYTELEGRLVSTADIYDRIKKKQIGYEEVMSTISKMTDEGGKFYDFQAKMAETLKVQLANLTLAWNNMLNAMGEEFQGVLVGGISTLKQVFLHWKDIEHVLYELVVALGAYKAYQIITTRLMGATATSLDAQVLAMKRNKAAMLEKQALTRKLTVDELRQVAAQNQVTAADYRNALSGKQLTKQKALLLVALNKNNVQLKAAVVNMGLLTTQEVANITAGKALAIVFKSIGISIRNAALAIKAFAASMWPLLVAGAIYELYHAWDSYGEHIKEVNKQAAEHAKEAFENIKQYLESESTINTRQRVVYKEGNPLTDAESQKAWDEMREKIELSSSASNTFIAKLMQINDINNRLAAGFDYLRDVQRVAGVMQTLEEDAVNIPSTVLGGLFGEGLKDDLTDFINAYQKYVSLNENLRQSSVGEEYFNKQKRALAEFRGEVEKTTTSLYNIASKEGFNTNEQREFFEREISEIAQAEQMGAKETRIFRMQAEKEYYAYARAQLVAQLEYQQGAQKAATEKRIKDLDNEFGANKALQESFFTWLTEKQDHAVKNMLRGKTQEEIKQGEWLKGSNAKWVEEMARKFSKEYGVSFDDLHRLILNANTWSINIPVFFQTIGQPLSDVQRDYEARTGKKFSSNPIIKDAKTQVDIIDTLKKKQKEVANEMETARKAGGKYWEDNKQRYKEENDALVADIHAYNALTDAEEKANKKRGKGGSKKDPLLDALKQEISLVEKLQSDYDKLSKSGASQADALDTIRGAYGKTIRLLNAQLGKYSLPQLDISQLITGKDPNKTLAHFKQTLDTLVSKGMLTLERSKEIEAVVEKFTLSAKTYNLDMITKGLNNELGKLKDEYELAVELDANPELGGIFADYMGIDLNELPKNAEEAAKKAQQYIDKILRENKSKEKIDIASLMGKDAFDKWIKSSGHGIEDDLVKVVDNYRQTLHKMQVDESKKQMQEWNKLLEKYAEYEYKKKQIAEEYEKEMSTALKMGADASILRAIENRRDSRYAELDFSEFMKTPEWITATGNLAGMSKAAIDMLIDRINKYKETAKYLSPKQIKELNKALKQLHAEQKKNNPFKAISNMLAEARERMQNFDKEINETEDKVSDLSDEINKTTEEGGDTSNQIKALEKLKEKLSDLKKAREEAGELDASEWVSSINETVVAVQAAVGVFNDLAKAIGGIDSNDINKAFGVLEKAGNTAAVGAAIGGGWGAVIGGVVGAATGIISWIVDSSDEKITSRIKESELAVKRLELAYIDLEHAVKEAYGMATIGANLAAKANKELQLVELKRQLALERSRDSKDRDEDKIIDLQKQIKELEYDIADTTDNIVNDLLGISSVGDAMENLMDGFIEALRSGEDAMATFDESVDEMIANMVKKMFTTKILQPWFEEQWNKIQNQITERAGKLPEELAKVLSSVSNARMADVNNNDSLVDALRNLGFSEEEIDRLNWFNEFGRMTSVGRNERLRAAYEKALKEAEQKEAETQKELATATMPTTDDIRQYAELLRSGQPIVEENMQEVSNFLRELGLMKDDANKNLSALQQGIQGITEDTAGALEGITNGISQQSYLQSDLLTQIRDTILGFDLDIQMGVLSEILLQLQSSYQIQMSIRDTLQGWSNASGMAVRVEMI